MPEYTLYRSKRKNLLLSVTRGGVIVKAPLRLPKSVIDAFVAQHAAWIEEKARILAQQEDISPLSAADIADLKQRAAEFLPDRVRFWGVRLAVTPTGVKITSAKSRWGSCSSRNSLCFSYRLMLLPEELRDYVVVHELAHIREKNHSRRFYAVVASVMPDYKRRVRELREISFSLPSEENAR